MSNIAQAAVGKWPAILSQLGIPDEFLQNRHGPCPCCGGTDRFRFDDREGRGTYFCNAHGAGDAFDLLMRYHNWDFKQTAREVERIVGTVERKPVQQESDPRIRLLSIQKHAGPVKDAVREYLFGRGLKTVPPGLMQGIDDYWCQGQKQGRYTVMLGKVVSRDGDPLTWHVTYLENGQKARVDSPKKIMKAVGKIGGGAIRLYPIAEHIGVAEGIETAIAAYELTGIPTWAVMSTAGMRAFDPPKGIKCVTVFADNDANYAGQAAAYQLAHDMVVQCEIEAEVRIPDRLGDWLDMLNN